MTFLRLSRAHALVFATALALLLSLAVDWYGTQEGDEARRIERITVPREGTAGEVSRAVDERAAEAGERRERNALSGGDAAPPIAVIDVLLVLALLAAIVPALASGFFCAAGKDARSSAAARLGTVTALVGAVLIAYRLAQQPGLDSVTTLKFGAFLSLALAVMLAASAASVGAPSGDPAPGSGREAPS